MNKQEAEAFLKAKGINPLMVISHYPQFNKSDIGITDLISEATENDKAKESYKTGLSDKYKLLIYAVQAALHSQRSKLSIWENTTVESFRRGTFWQTHVYE